MYHNIDRLTSIDILNQVLSEICVAVPLRLFLVQSLSLISESLYVSFESTLYKIVRGWPTGLRFVNMLADIMMTSLETDVLTGPNRFGFYCRYVDDILIISNREVADAIIYAMNIISGFEFNTKYAVGNEKIKYLDLFLYISNNSIHYEHCLKSENERNIISYRSVVPNSYKTTSFLNFLSRNSLLNENEEHKIKQVIDYKKFLLKNNYTIDWIDDVYNKFINKNFTGRMNAGNKWYSLPYNMISNKFKTTREYVNISLKPAPSLIGLLRARNGINILSRFNIVYKIKCSVCEYVYVGETSRLLKTRLSEHRYLYRLKSTNSPFYMHWEGTGHIQNFDDVAVLCYEKNKSRRKIIEALYIKRFMPCVMNMNGQSVPISDGWILN